MNKRDLACMPVYLAVVIIGVWLSFAAADSVREFYAVDNAPIEVRGQYERGLTKDELCIATIRQWMDACRVND